MLVSLVPVHDIMIPQTFPESCTNGSQVLPRGPNVPKASALAVVLVLFVVFGVMGNVLVILSVVCHRTLRGATHYFIANLAVADLLLSCTVLPFSVVSETLGRWVFGRTFCGVWAAMDVLCCTASIMSLCVISVDRYIGVSFPLRYPSMVTERRALLVLAMLWVLAVTISIGPLVGWKEPPPEDESVCQITEEPGYAIFSALGSFYLPLVVILSMYCRVYVVARRETRGLMSGQKTQRWNASSGAVTLRIHRGNATAPEDEVLRNRMHLTLRLLRFSREKKAAKTLGIVVGCFILCWLPFFLVLPIGSIFPRYRPSDTVFKITFWLGYFNSCINPIIYPCSSQEFKKAFVSILGARCLRSRSRRLQSPRPRPSHLLATSARLSPSASAALFPSSSSRDGVECQAPPLGPQW